MDSKGSPYPNAPGGMPMPAQSQFQPQSSGYPHQQSYSHPPPPPPYDANANMIPPNQPQAAYVHTIVAAPRVGPDPASITCPSCQKHVITRLDYETSTKTHIMAGLLCLFICWPCFWIPYVVDSCKNANHYCPHCSAYIGTYRS
ncbi:lipopolysaccharide-induced tumor necrosis factor-alpha factor homolog [Toxorhynchites rutilus septentrionalis]|uniref:lipopolysaccharide-induced tumor necrosis factor-alpha factor homolog n=1 Tax=Toxorhynchites rutilus septentrionalis TaxID=329112 RepID=UPI002479C148|nr:lipopolysaccharide-induced tumor necrosis factor-alpha factor homolog [Toxorhynchites rutilus septentrionalis]XP_055640987.1 lipopolysaccharide-induced tumor necrosis factor-alpha factor homolog [Toxorhynchites rutilus septentrionalis]